MGYLACIGGRHRITRRAAGGSCAGIGHYRCIGGFHRTDVVRLFRVLRPFDIIECQRMPVFLDRFRDIRHIHFRHIGILPCGRQRFRHAFCPGYLGRYAGHVQIGRAAVAIIRCYRFAFGQQRHDVVGIIRCRRYCHRLRVHLAVYVRHLDPQHVLKRIVHIAAIKIILWDLIGRCPGWHIVDFLTGKAVCTHLNINRIACA